MINVMKFFRTHNRKILGVLMALLMVVFLGGTALENMLRPTGNPVIAETKLGTITDMDREIARSNTELLERMGFRWSQPFPGVEEPLSPVDWVILNREAKQLGTHRDVAAVRNMIGDPVLSSRIDEVARRERVKSDRIIEAIGQLQTVQETAKAVAVASLPSEAEVRNTARMGLEKAKVQIVLLTANMFSNPEETFSEAELLDHFNRYKERQPGRGLDFGYRFGPAARIQYIKIDRAQVASKVGIPSLEAKARKFYEENRERNPLFFKTPDELDKDKAAQEPGAPPAPPYKDWAAAEPIALKLVREDYSDEAAKKLADWLIGHLSEPWLGAETEKDGFKKAPAGVSDLGAYEAAVKRVPSTLAFPEAVSVVTSDFFTASTAVKILGVLGGATVDPDRRHPGTLTSLVLNTKGIVSAVPEKGANPADYLVPYQTSTHVLQDSIGDVYVFRVLETREPRTPDSLGEVREKVVEDLRVQRGFDRALLRASSLKSCTADVSLKEAYESDEELLALKQRPKGWGSGFFEPPPFSRTFLAAAARGQKEPATFIQGGVGPVPSSVADACFELEESLEKTGIFELRDRPTVMVVQWLETLRIPENEFQNQKDQLVRDMTNARAQAAIADWLTPDKLRARNEFKPQSEVRLR